jgi:uncharacterized protein YoxC
MAKPTFTNIVEWKIQGEDKVIRGTTKVSETMRKSTKQIKGTTESTKQLANSQKILNNESDITYRNNRNLLNSFSVLRSKLLLASFAAGMLTKTLGRYVGAAGDAEETTNKFNVVFGETAQEAREFAEALGDSVGRATSSLMTMMASLQDTFVPLGFAREDAAELSKGLTELTLDVASFQNAADDEVMRAFQSAIVGNHEAVRGYGIILTEATLKQEAVKLGIMKSGEELSAQEKILARVSLIHKGSNDAIGDLINTYDSYQNSVKRLNNAQKELIENLGTVLMPIAEDVVALFAHLTELFSDESRIRGYALSLVLVADAFAIYRIATMGAIAATQGFKRAVAATGFGILVVAIGELAARTIFATEESEKFEKQSADLQNTIDKLKNSVQGTTDATKELAEWTRSTYEEVNKSNGLLNTVMQIQINKLEHLSIAWSDLTDAQKTYHMAGQGLSEDEFNARVEFNAKLNQATMTDYEQKTALLDMELEVFKAHGISEIDLEIYKQARLKDIREQSASHSINLASAMASALSVAFDPDAGAGDAFKGFIIQVLQMIQQVILASSALSSALTASWVPGLGVAAASAAFIALEAAKAKVREVKFAATGMNEVVTQPTMIIAGEAGAEHVNITPLSGGSSSGQSSGGAGVTVNITGGVVDQDYVRNELIPALNRATGTGSTLNA